MKKKTDVWAYITAKAQINDPTDPDYGKDRKQALMNANSVGPAHVMNYLHQHGKATKIEIFRKFPQMTRGQRKLIFEELEREGAIERLKENGTIYYRAIA